MEAGRPDTLTRAKLRAIRQAGISRISINPQTMNDRTLEVIGRAHTAQQVRDAYALAREEEIPHINMDVIAGLPGENEADFARTLEEARKLRPESFTVHTLAIKRSSRMSLEKHPLPDGEMTARMVDAGRETARAMGMVPYYLYKQKQMAGNLENTGYALPGHACLYNVDIMEETSHILAMGAGGISKRIWPEEGHITRAPNVSNILEYISRTENDKIKRKADNCFPFLYTSLFAKLLFQLAADPLPLLAGQFFHIAHTAADNSFRPGSAPGNIKLMQFPGVEIKIQIGIDRQQRQGFRNSFLHRCPLPYKPGRILRLRPDHVQRQDIYFLPRPVQLRIPVVSLPWFQGLRIENPGEVFSQVQHVPAAVFPAVIGFLKRGHACGHNRQAAA